MSEDEECMCDPDGPYDCLDDDYVLSLDAEEEISEWSRSADPGWDYSEDRHKLALVDDPDQQT
ncbi:hypothetical protein MAUB1S_01469 [Mycolicibacterium aubagnense]